MATAVVRYTAAAITDRGRKRTSNEDAFGYSVEHGVYVVCDGMGGAAAGEIASSLAVDEVLRLVTERVSERVHLSNTPSVVGAGGLFAPAQQFLPAVAEEAVIAANQAIHSRAQRNLRLNGMGTTLVGLLAAIPDEFGAEPDVLPRVYIMNIGDSRCYRLRRGRIELCTQDHSLVEEQIRMGRMTRSEAARSPLRNVITRVVGTQSSVTADLIEAQVEPGDLFLLCSDGLTRELSDEKIEAILNDGLSSPTRRLNASVSAAETQLDGLCASLVQAANKAGGHDNITCLIVRVD